MTAFAVRFARNKGGIIGLLVLAAVLAMAAAAPILYPAGPWEMVGRPLLPPFGPEHFLGTDALGRDIAAGVVHGARVSLLLGVTATVASVGTGLLIGACGGYFGGLADELLMGLTEIFQIVPGFALAVVLVAIFTPRLGSIIVAIAAISWPSVARLVRGEFLALRRREFVQAAIVLGQGPARIIFRQILPNALSPIIVTATMMVATAILLESSLSFLGLGDPDLMSWGYMVGAGRNFIRQAWWIATFPGIAILLTVLALNLVGDALGDALNPRLAREGRA